MTNSFLSAYQGEMKMYAHTKTFTWMSMVMLFTVEPNWKEAKYSLNGEQILKLCIFNQLLTLISKKKHTADSCKNMSEFKRILC